MYFNNPADPQDSEKLGEIATNLLITDLTESHYLNVVSSQRLYDILKLLGREGEKKINRDMATEVAIKTRCRWMLLGNILQARPRIIITSQLVDVESGSAIASQRITGEVDDNIFTLVDKLTVEIKNDLSLPAVAREEPDRPVADVTTQSPEAYRYYLEGMGHLYKLYFKEAESYFTKALEYDTTFAMAYLWLAWIKRGSSEGEKMIAKAEECSNKISQKKRHYIMSFKARISGNYSQAIQEIHKIVERYPDEKVAFLLLGLIYLNSLRQPQEAIHPLTKAIEIDPLYKFPYNLLAYAYNDIGDVDKAIWAINQYISLAPDEANPYDTRGDLYAYHGKIDQAIESYNKRALEIKPDFSGSLDKLGYMYLFKAEYPKAESCFKELASSSEKPTRSKGRLYLALIPLFQGRLGQALEILDDGIAADRMEQAEEWQNSDKHLQKAWIYWVKKNLTLTLTERERCMEIYRKAYPDRTVYERHFYVQLLADNGNFKKAEESAGILKKEIEEKDPTLMYFYWLAAGYIELTRGNFKESATYFEKAARDNPNFWVHYGLARAYLELSRLDEAVANFEKALSLSRYELSTEYNAIWAVKAHYLLGLAYEKSGWKTKAVEKYQEFLDFWKDADPGIGEVEDAKARLQASKGVSSK
ncbi:MAG: tetratricopeptide repeat protein [Candidatus Hodarchaeota archaeon]